MSNPIRSAVLRRLDASEKSVAELVEQVAKVEGCEDVTPRQISRVLVSLEGERKAKRTGTTRGTRWTKRVA